MTSPEIKSLEAVYIEMFGCTLDSRQSDLIHDLLRAPALFTEFARSCAHHRVQEHLADWMLDSGAAAEGFDAKAVITEAKARAMRQRHAAGSAVKRLQESGIECMVLRGPVAAERLFKKAYLRQSRDLDLIVRKGSVKTAAEALISLGYTPAGTFESFERSGEWPLKGIGLTLELHWDAYPVLGAGSLGPAGEDYWAEAEPVMIESVEVKGLSKRHLLLSSILHAAYEHQMDRLVRIVDIAQCVRVFGARLDWDWIADKCLKGRRATAACKVLGLAERITGCGVPKEIIDRLGAKARYRSLANALLPDSGIIAASKPAPWLRRYLFLQLLKRAN